MKYFRAPEASYEEANALLGPLFNDGDRFMQAPAIQWQLGGLLYWGWHDDPSAFQPLYKQEAWACAYVLGEFSDNPAYAAPANVEEITEAQWRAAEPQVEM